MCICAWSGLPIIQERDGVGGGGEEGSLELAPLAGCNLPKTILLSRRSMLSQI